MSIATSTSSAPPPWSTPRLACRRCGGNERPRAVTQLRHLIAVARRGRVQRFPALCYWFDDCTPCVAQARKCSAITNGGGQQGGTHETILPACRSRIDCGCPPTGGPIPQP